MTHHTISIKVDSGTGDYGTSERVVFDAPCPSSEAKETAQFFATKFKTQATLFRGRTLGKFVNSFFPQ